MAYFHFPDIVYHNSVHRSTVPIKIKDICRKGHRIPKKLVTLFLFSDMNSDGNVTVRRKAYASHGGQEERTELCINSRHSQKLLPYLRDSEVVFFALLRKKMLRQFLSCQFRDRRQSGQVHPYADLSAPHCLCRCAYFGCP